MGLKPIKCYKRYARKKISTLGLTSWFSACCQEWWFESNPRNPHDGRKETFPVGFPLPLLYHQSVNQSNVNVFLNTWRLGFLKQSSPDWHHPMDSHPPTPSRTPVCIHSKPALCCTTLRLFWGVWELPIMSLAFSIIVTTQRRRGFKKTRLA